MTTSPEAAVYECATTAGVTGLVELAEAMRAAGWLAKCEADDPVSWLVDVTDPREAKRVAAVLLVALAADDDVLEQADVGRRARLLDLIRTAFGSELRKYDIEVDAQAHVFIGQLAAVFPQVLDEIESATNGFVEPNRFQADRNRLQASIGRHRPLIDPLVSSELTKQRLAEVLDAVEAVIDARGPDLVSAHSRAIELVDSRATEIESSGGAARQVLKPAFERLRSLVSQVFNESPVTRPASLTVAAANKKYPLHSAGSPLRLYLAINNAGPGQALDVYLDKLEAIGVELVSDTSPIGTMMPGHLSTYLEARVLEPDEGVAFLGGVVKWTNSDGSAGLSAFEVTFSAQRADIDWDSLVQPYDLEPVASDHEFAGRGDVLGQLRGLVARTRVGNAFVLGQKRVGKTSIVLAFKRYLETQGDVVPVYLEAGTFVATDGLSSIQSMGVALCEELQAADQRFADLEVPEFRDNLAPVKSFIGHARRHHPKLRVVFLIDEFDDLPVELYRRGAVGDALFLSLRTLAGLEHVGFVLVGGEKMAPIVTAQGQRLNKFENLRITLFDREQHWGDFADLVRFPTREWLEISDDALVYLFEATHGHPYFTKLVCQQLFQIMHESRDAHVAVVEMQRATDRAEAKAGEQNFAHFWEDGVVGSGVEVEEVSVRRRIWLLALARALRDGDSEAAGVRRKAADYGLGADEIDNLERDFERRGIVEEVDGQLRAQVPFFGRWLAHVGVHDLVTTFADPGAVLNARARAERDEVTASEVAILTSSWGSYRGRTIASDEVRSWLSQFETPRARRLMFKVLQAVRFYDAATIRARLREAHGIVRRDSVHRLDNGRRRNDIVVSFLGEINKSGVRYARLYAQENSIYTDRVVDHAKLPEVLKDDGVQTLVLVDDLVASGQQASEYLADLDRKVGGLLAKRGIKVVFVAIAGFGVAERRLEEQVAGLDMRVAVHICETLGDSDRLFSEDSTAFADDAERLEARGIAESYGRGLERKNPLGYGDAQAAIVFEESCPNGSLPILWGKRNDFSPLFPRH